MTKLKYMRQEEIPETALESLITAIMKKITSIKMRAKQTRISLIIFEICAIMRA